MLVGRGFKLSVQETITEVIIDTRIYYIYNDQDGTELYFCDDYVLTIQTASSGDLDRSARSLCGYGADQLMILQTKQDK